MHHLRTQMADELTTLREIDDENRKRAELRLAVSLEVAREVRRAQEEALLSLRDGGVINDQTYLSIQLEMDRSERPA